MDRSERQPPQKTGVEVKAPDGAGKVGSTTPWRTRFLSDFKNLLLGRRLESTPKVATAPTEQKADLQSSSRTVVQHEPTGATVITATTDRKGGLSHTFMNVDPDINASSLGKPLSEVPTPRATEPTATDLDQK